MNKTEHSNINRALCYHFAQGVADAGDKTKTASAGLLLGSTIGLLSMTNPIPAAILGFAALIAISVGGVSKMTGETFSHLNKNYADDVSPAKANYFHNAGAIIAVGAALGLAILTGNTLHHSFQNAAMSSENQSTITAPVKEIVSLNTTGAQPTPAFITPHNF